MAYWIKRIILKTGEVVTEAELSPEMNRSDGPAPLVGDIVTVTCRGRTFQARIVVGSYPGREYPPELVLSLRAEEI
jgi:hypothetical protein